MKNDKEIERSLKGHVAVINNERCALIDDDFNGWGNQDGSYSLKTHQDQNGG